MPKNSMINSIGQTIECQICHGHFKSLMSHINRIHGVNGNKYIKMFNLPSGSLVSEKLKKELTVTAKNMIGHKGFGITDKAHIGLKRWMKENPEKVKKIATMNSHAGDKARKLYWTEEERLKKKKFMEMEGKKRWRDETFKKKMQKNVDNFTKIRQEESKRLNLLEKKCVWCKKKFRPKDVFGGLRKSSKNFVDQYWFCSKDCNRNAKKGKSFTQFSIYIKKEKDKYEMSPLR